MLNQLNVMEILRPPVLKKWLIEKHSIVSLPLNQETISFN